MKAILGSVVLAGAILAFSGCVYAAGGLRKHLPSNESSKYYLYVSIVYLTKSGDGPATFFAAVADEKNDGKVLVKYKRTIVLENDRCIGEMKGKNIIVTVLDTVHSDRKWVVEFAPAPNGMFHLIREEGTYK